MDFIFIVTFALDALNHTSGICEEWWSLFGNKKEKHDYGGPTLIPERILNSDVTMKIVLASTITMVCATRGGRIHITQTDSNMFDSLFKNYF